MIDNALACPKGGIVLAWNYDAAKEWGALGARALTPSAISYEPKIFSRTVHRVRTRAGVWKEGDTDKGGIEIVGESQGGGENGRARNDTPELVRRRRQVVVPAESRADINTHGF